MFLPKYACDGGPCDRQIRNYRATPPPKYGSTYVFNILLLLDRLVLHPRLHIHSDRRTAADTFGDPDTDSFIRRTASLTHIRVIIRLKT